MPVPPDAELPRIPELVGATSRSFQVSGRVTSIELEVTEPSGPASRHAEHPTSGAPLRIFLNMERMRSPVGSPPVLVYLNVPAPDSPAQHPELLAGELPMFGLLEASISDESHVPTGLDAQLEITSIYPVLAAREGFDPNKLRVTFVSRYGGSLPVIEIGRVSLYFA